MTDGETVTGPEAFTALGPELRQALSEWTRDHLNYGVLLSGGSDSRLAQAAMDCPVTTFHIADWMSREARLARRAARARSDEFVLLKRDDTYYERTLNQAPALSAFSGWFDQAYFTAFEDDITDRIDVLVSGLYADMLFSGAGLRTADLSLGAVGTLSVPLHREIGSIREYAEAVVDEAPDSLPYSERTESATELVLNNIRREGRQIVSHGVRYNSLRDLMMYGDFYPIDADTDAIFSRSLIQSCPYRTPFLDKRLLNLQQRIPVRYLLRRNIVNRALTRLAPDLAAIPHSRTGIPPKYPFIINYIGGNLNGFKRKHVFEESPPQSHFDHGPWPNRPDLVRNNDLVAETIRSNEQLIEELPKLDYDRILECYRSHERGKNNLPILYSLVTLLGMPVTRQACAPNDGNRNGQIDVGRASRSTDARTPGGRDG
jgi:asparagine synthase (glutamine-hydrolysing)